MVHLDLVVASLCYVRSINTPCTFVAHLATTFILLCLPRARSPLVAAQLYLQPVAWLPSAWRVLPWPMPPSLVSCPAWFLLGVCPGQRSWSSRWVRKKGGV
jgi:hypothetical protein